MKKRALNRQQIKKWNTRFYIEKIKKCESCVNFFKSTCQKTGSRTYKNETACFMYDEKA
jgi:hypothetical protein